MSTACLPDETASQTQFNSFSFFSSSQINFSSVIFSPSPTLSLYSIHPIPHTSVHNRGASLIASLQLAGWLVVSELPKALPACHWLFSAGLLLTSLPAHPRKSALTLPHAYYPRLIHAIYLRRTLFNQYPRLPTTTSPSLKRPNEGSSRANFSATFWSQCFSAFLAKTLPRDLAFAFAFLFLRVSSSTAPRQPSTTFLPNETQPGTIHKGRIVVLFPHCIRRIRSFELHHPPPFDTFPPTHETSSPRDNRWL